MIPLNRWYNESDSSILFPVDLVLEGDILIRVRHLTHDGKRLSMLRFVCHPFHAPKQISICLPCFSSMIKTTGV
jgi:hypothetical protein